MKLPYLLAPFAFLGLASAAPPPPAPDAAAEYPRCSATVTDRCVQGHRRGRAAGAMPELDALGPAPMPEPRAVRAPVQMSGRDYPPCTAARQDRCAQRAGTRAEPRAATRYAMAERERVRIGERG
jgi:hypothetical protein